MDIMGIEVTDMDDLISRQAAISHVDDVPYIKEHPNVGLLWKAWIESLPPAQQEKHTENTRKTHACDCIERQAAIDALNGIINRFEQILRDIRESKVDDSVCGMCEYDGAFVGQSGDWCNECPGFEKDDCFKLSDECRKRWLESVKLPSAQQWIPWDSGKFPKESGTYTVTAYDGATKRVTYAKYQKRLKRWELTGARAYWRVLAWMEKPAPWKGEQDG